jgi:RNA polymerase sigma-70 factor, ECF subfamily
MADRHGEALRGTDAAAAADAFTALVAAHADDSYRLAWLILRDRADAEDAVHDAYLAAWRGRRSLRDPGRVDAWLARIVANACRDRLRRTRRHPVEPLAGEPAAAEGAFDMIHDRVALESAFVGLSPEQRVLIVLRFERDLTVEQIAELLEIPSGTVKSRLHHALRSMRAALAGSPRRIGAGLQTPEADR